MPTQTQTKTTSEPSADFKQKLQGLRELYADAPEMARVALENVLPTLAPPTQGTPVTSAGRVGKSQGEVSELTVIAPLAKGGAKRLRGLLKFLNGRFDGADLVGT